MAELWRSEFRIFALRWIYVTEYATTLWGSGGQSPSVDGGDAPILCTIPRAASFQQGRVYPNNSDAQSRRPPNDPGSEFLMAKLHVPVQTGII